MGKVDQFLIFYLFYFFFKRKKKGWNLNERIEDKIDGNPNFVYVAAMP